MPHFKDVSGNLFFLSDQDIDLGWLNKLPAGLTQITDAEADALRIPPPPTPEQFQQMVGFAVDQMLDELAKSWRYLNATRLLAAKGSSNAKYNAEGTAFEAYWADCWSTLDQLESDVIAGTAQMPATVDDVLALLPAPPERPGV